MDAQLRDLYGVSGDADLPLELDLDEINGMDAGKRAAFVKVRCRGGCGVRLTAAQNRLGGAAKQEDVRLRCHCMSITRHRCRSSSRLC